MEDLIQRAAKTIQDLGIATPDILEPHIRAYTQGPPATDTSDEDTELAQFLSGLFRAGIITRVQGRTLLSMLTERAAGVDDPNVGRRFGEYVAESLVGEGAMGKVYRAAREGTFERGFVIKVFGSQEAAGVARFRRECQVMAALDHPNIVKVVASGQEDSAPYLVLEYVEGPTLEQMLTERGRFSWKSATRAVKQIALALAEAHEKGVIHRDVKPQNILVGPGGVLKVFDFGLAKSLDTCSVSQAGEILGSPAYMAPEQWGDHSVDERVDLFALGVVYYLLITGCTPFRGRTPADYAGAVQVGAFPPARSHVPEVPSAVEELITQLLEKDRNDRPPSVRAVLADLDRILRGKPPNVPRLEGEGGEPRFALVGAVSYKAGSDLAAAIRLDAEGVAAQHAVVERTVNGLLLRAIDGAEVRVNGNAIREIVLRDKDTVRFGSASPLTFRGGNLSKRATTRQFAPVEGVAVGEEEPRLAAPEPPVVVSGMLAAALEDAAHGRALTSCFEGLDPYTAELVHESSRLALFQAGFPKDLIERALARAQELSDRRMWRLSDALFTLTRENLGRSVEAWLAWWFEARARYPRQLRGPGTRARGVLNVTAPDKSLHSLDLAEGEHWILGRADDADITIKEKSVSRQHLSILRLNTRFAYRDLGSRFGVTIGGNRMEVGLLRHGDELRLGRAKCVFRDWVQEHIEAITRDGSALVEIDRDTFQALVEARFPGTTMLLVRLLDLVGLADQMVAAAAPFEDFTTIGALVMTFLEQQRELALEGLPAITGTNFGDDVPAWQAWFTENAPRLGPQVAPRGWIGA